MRYIISFIIAILIIFLFVQLVEAQSIQARHQAIINMKHQGAAGCSTPSGTTLSEGFEGIGYEDGMADNAGSPDEDETSFLANPPDGVCTYCLRTDADNGAECDAEYDYTTPINFGTTDYHFRAALYIDDATDWSTYASSTIINFDPDTDGWNADNEVKLRQGAEGAWTIYCNGSSSNSGYEPISFDTWYIVDVFFDHTTPADSWFGVSGVDTSTFTHSNESTFRYLRIGPSNLPGDDDLDIVWGYVYD